MKYPEILQSWGTSMPQKYPFVCAIYYVELAVTCQQLSICQKLYYPLLPAACAPSGLPVPMVELSNNMHLSVSSRFALCADIRVTSRRTSCVLNTTYTMSFIPSRCQLVEIMFLHYLPMFSQKHNRFYLKFSSMSIRNTFGEHGFMMENFTTTPGILL